MFAGPQNSSRAPAQRRRKWLTLQSQQPTLEESCRRAHAFASRFPALYRCWVAILIGVCAAGPFLVLPFLAAIAIGLPWATTGNDTFAVFNDEPATRWIVTAIVYAALAPLAGVMAAGLVRGLTLRLPEPEGKRLEPADAPRLYRMLGEMAKSLDAPEVEEVRILVERVLEIRHEPCGRPGVLGRARTILLLGLPLAEELSPQQFRALVAHELAHMATHKRRFGGRVLGLRRRLDSLRRAAEASALERGFWSRLPDENLVDMLHATMRRLTPATFPAVRQHETEADAIAAAIAGREFAASALLRERIAGHAVSHQFHQQCLRLAETSPEIPADMFERRAALGCGAFAEAQVNAWLRAELEVKDNLAESHPPLWDRLRLLGYELKNMADFRNVLEQTQPQCELGETAARFFLGDAAETFRREFFAQWAAHQAADWRKRFAVYESMRVTAAAWESQGTEATGSPAELWNTAVATGNTRGWRAALPLAMRILDIEPEHADANLLVGQIMLEDGNAAGIEAIERAMTREPGMVPAGCTLAGRFLEARGERDAAAAYRKRCEEHQKQEQSRRREDGQVLPSDEFLAPNCPAVIAQSLAGVVERHGSHIRAAYLMRRNTPNANHEPQYVLGIERRLFLYENAALANRLLLERLMRAGAMPEGVVVCVVTRSNRELLDKWKRSPHALLYSRAAGGSSSAQPELAGVEGAERLLRQAPASNLPARSSPATAK